MHNLQTLKSMLLTLPPEALIDAVLEDNKGSAFSPLLKDDTYIEQFTPFLENAARGAGDLDKLFCAVIQRDEVSPRALRHLAGYSSGGSDGLEDNPNTPADALLEHYYAEVSGRYLLSGKSFASHRNLCPELAGLLFNDCIDKFTVMKALAKNPATPDAILFALMQEDTLNKIKDSSSSGSYHYGSRHSYSSNGELSKQNKAEILCAIAMNPNLSQDSMEYLLFSKDSIGSEYKSSYCALMKNPSLPISVALSWLNMEDTPLGDDGVPVSEEVRMSDMTTALTERLKAQESATPYSVNPVFLKEDGLYTLLAQGYDPEALYATRKIKHTLNTLIGSSHKEEIALFERSKAICTSTFSALQYIFTDQNGKLDRHNYLLFLSKLNALSVDGEAFNIAGPALRICKDVIGLDGLLRVAELQNTDGCRDTLTFLNSVLASPYEEEMERQIKLVQRWLKKYDTYGDMFHDYLKNKERRDGGAPPMMHFYQRTFSHLVDEINHKLENLPIKDKVSVSLPENSFELAAIGRSQRHCVGGHHYASGCASGQYVIFGLKVNGSMKHGFTFQFNRTTGTLIQQEGFARAAVPKQMEKLAKACFHAMRNEGEMPANPLR